MRFSLPRAAWIWPFGLAVGWAGGAQAEPMCQPLPQALPAVPELHYVSDYPNDDLAVDYYRWDDYCYGGAPLKWKEWRESNDWDLGAITLTRRLDYYRPSNLPLSQPLPLVIYAHPGGQTEDFRETQPGDKLPHVHSLLMKVLAAGYAFATIESRHPLGSFIVQRPPGHDKPGWPQPTTAPVPSDDIATAVRWIKFKRDTFAINPDQVVLVGQSRGSAALLNALLNEAGDPKATDWRSQSSVVKGAFVYQAQTSYLETEIAPVFIKETGDNGELYRYWFLQDSPDVIIKPKQNIPGSAVQLARATPRNQLVPVHMAYDRDMVLQPDGVTIQPQCYETNNENRAEQEFDDDNNPDTNPPKTEVKDMPRCPHDGDQPKLVFDVHDANFSQFFAQAYADQKVANRITRCMAVGVEVNGKIDDRLSVEAAYAEVVPFVKHVLNDQLFFTNCPKGGHYVPPPPSHF